MTDRSARPRCKKRRHRSGLGGLTPEPSVCPNNESGPGHPDPNVISEHCHSFLFLRPVPAISGRNLRADSIRTTVRHAPHGRHRARADRLRRSGMSRCRCRMRPNSSTGYMLPGDVKPPEGGTERRRQTAPRAPSVRTLVKWAQKCDSAEQLGERLKRRYDRQRQRAGLAPAGNARAQAELDRTSASHRPTLWPRRLSATMRCGSSTAAACATSP